jgi:hypothetical protein
MRKNDAKLIIFGISQVSLHIRRDPHPIIFVHRMFGEFSIVYDKRGPRVVCSMNNIM